MNGKLKTALSKRNIAIICFAITAIDHLFSALSYFSIWQLIYAIGSISVVISFLTHRLNLAKVGFGIFTAMALRTLYIYIFRELIWLEPTHLWFYILDEVLMVLYWGFLLIACIFNKQLRKFSIAASVSMSLSFVLDKIVYTVWYGEFPFRFYGTVISVAYIVGGFLFPYAYGNKCIKGKGWFQKSSNEPITSEEENIEQLGRLKILLENGIITQEEFDAKKNEFIG